MKLFETHAHLDFKDYAKDLPTVLKKAQENGVEYFINVGIDEETSLSSIKLAEKYDPIYAAIGYHPHDVHKFDLQVLEKLYRHKKVTAIGEIGLDYYKNYNPKNLQLEVFEAQIEFACEKKMPIIIHDRDAHEDTLQLLLRHKPKEVVFHCFSGDAHFAEKILQEGWYLSFTGVITFKNSNLNDVINITPSDRFFFETDSPYLAPLPFRGKRNSPEYLPYIAQKFAEVKRIAPNSVALAAYENALRFFLKKSLPKN